MFRAVHVSSLRYLHYFNLCLSATVMESGISKINKWSSLTPPPSHTKAPLAPSPLWIRAWTPLFWSCSIPYGKILSLCWALWSTIIQRHYAIKKPRDDRSRLWHPQMWKCRYMWKVAKCEKNSTLNVKIDAICDKITLNVKKLGSLNVSNISTLNVLQSTLYVQTLFWRYLWKSNFNAFLISER